MSVTAPYPQSWSTERAITQSPLVKSGSVTVNSYTIETSDSSDTFEIDANITSVSAIDNDDDLVIEGTLQADGSAPKSSPGSSGSSGSGACAPYQGTKDDPQFDSFCQSAWNFKCAGNNDGSAASCAQWKQIKDDNPTINKTCIYCP